MSVGEREIVIDGAKANSDRKRVVIYLRFRSYTEDPNETFDGQKAQYIQRIRQESNLRLVGIYSDEMSSDPDQECLGFKTMLEDAKQGDFDVIICRNMSRLSVRLVDAMRTIYELRKLPQPIGVYFESEQIYTLDKRTEMLLSVLTKLAEEESQNKSRNGRHHITVAEDERHLPNELGQYEKNGILRFKAGSFDGISADEQSCIQHRVYTEQYRKSKNKESASTENKTDE